jgi:hypothetical protein
MKNLISKLLPLINKFKGKKPIVIILSVVAIAAGVFAAQKGYINEESLNFEAIINVVSDAFASAPVDSVAIPIEPVDTLAIEVVVDSTITQ